MSTKYTLASFAAMMFLLNSCTKMHSTSAYKTDNVSAVPTQTDKRAILKNYNTICAKASKDEYGPLITKALKYVAACPHGQEILKSMRYPVNVQSEKLIKHRHGQYNPDTVLIDKNYLKNNSTGMIAKTIMHEMLHHLQQERRQTPLYNSYSCDQAFIVLKLHEAEAAAWDDVVLTGYTYIDQRGANINGDLKKFMNTDLSAQFSPTSIEYIFQQALRKTKGNRIQAEKIAVGQRIAMYMSEKIPNNRVALWRSTYDLHSSVRTYHSYLKNHIRLRGNKKDIQHIFDFYEKVYGLKEPQISKIFVTEKVRPYYNFLMGKIKNFEEITKEEEWDFIQKNRLNHLFSADSQR